MKIHHYKASLTWQGNLGNDTKSYKAYSRDHELRVDQKPPIPASSDPSFRGNPDRYNPEELFLSSLSSCHMLWYLHLCSQNAIRVVSYCDEPRGIMEEDADGGGSFKSVTLYPKVMIREEKHTELAITLHKEAAKKCFIANSCNFKVNHRPTIGVFGNTSPEQVKK